MDFKNESKIQPDSSFGNPNMYPTINAEPPPYSGPPPTHQAPNYAPQYPSHNVTVVPGGVTVVPGATVVGGTTVIGSHTVVSRAVVVGNSMGPKPSYITCRSCNQEVTTRVDRTSTSRTHLFALLLCLFGCWPCVCIPYCMDSCRNAEHYCPNCNAYIGSYSR